MVMGRDRDRRYEERRERFRERIRDLRQRIRIGPEDGEAEAVSEADIRDLGNNDDLRPQQRSPWDLASNIFCLFFASIFPDPNHHQTI